MRTRLIFLFHKFDNFQNELNFEHFCLKTFHRIFIHHFFPPILIIRIEEKLITVGATIFFFFPTFQALSCIHFDEILITFTHSSFRAPVVRRQLRNFFFSLLKTSSRFLRLQKKNSPSFYVITSLFRIDRDDDRNTTSKVYYKSKKARYNKKNETDGTD